mgnify:CR=1 FL=1
MEKTVQISILLETYGKLLTEKQYQMLDDYYNNDLSLSEIAENANITRQAVRDNLKKGESKLFEYEEKLGIMKKTLMQEEKIASILSEITKIKEHTSDKEIARILEDVKSKLNCLV